MLDLSVLSAEMLINLHKEVSRVYNTATELNDELQIVVADRLRSRVLTELKRRPDALLQLENELLQVLL